MRHLVILVAVLLGALADPAFPAGTTHSLLMKGVAFEPRQITVHVGDALKWANQDIVAHTATAKDKSWDINVPAGRSGRVVMEAVGRFGYICRYHPNMTGEIIVEP